VNTKAITNVALAAGAAITLSGCVAAAIPIIAGGAMTRTVTDGKDADFAPKPDEQPAPQAPQSVEPIPVAQAPAASIPQPTPTPTPTSKPTSTAPEAATPAAPTPPSPPKAQPESDASDSQPQAQPAPQPRPTSSFADFVMKERARTFSDILAYVNNLRMRGDKAVPSALLVDRAELTTARKPCPLGAPQTILFDLDPEGGVFDPGAMPKAPPLETNAIESLRAAGIAITWISGNTLSSAQAIRTSLRMSGLDPAGADRVLLIRGPEDRKQKLRDDLASETCLVAIAGDQRSDFDELYDYLLNPEDARSLDPLIGDGWFILPTTPEQAGS